MKRGAGTKKEKLQKGWEENEKSEKVSDKGWKHQEEQRKQRTTEVGNQRGGKVWTSGEEREEIRAEKDAVRSQGQLQGHLSEW